MNDGNNNKVISSSSSSASRSYSSPSSNSSVLPQTPRRTMEEIWRDIAPLNHNHHHHHHHPAAAASHSSFRALILQDYLAGSFKDPNPASASATAAAALPPPTSPPPTVLSLSSGLDFHHHQGGPESTNNYSNSGYVNVFQDPAAMPSPPPGSILSFCAKRQPNDATGGGGGGGGDHRHKRMIKNRESAARSRARKQAYRNELELEVAHLVEENERLRRQYEELRIAMAAQQTKKRTLQRTSTAPF